MPQQLIKWVILHQVTGFYHSCYIFIVINNLREHSELIVQTFQTEVTCWCLSSYQRCLFDWLMEWPLLCCLWNCTQLSLWWGSWEAPAAVWHCRCNNSQKQQTDFSWYFIKSQITVIYCSHIVDRWRILLIWHWIHHWKAREGCVLGTEWEGAQEHKKVSKIFQSF